MKNDKQTSSSDSYKNITRRKIIKTSLMTAASIAVCSNQASATPPPKKKLRVAIPANLSGDNTLFSLSSQLKRICGLDIEISASLPQGSTPLGAIADGSAEMAYTSKCIEDKLPDHFFFFSGIPFGMNSIEMISWLKQDNGQRLLDESFAEMDLKAWVIKIKGSSTGSWHRAPLTKSSDYSKKKIIAHGISQRVFKKMGSVLIDYPTETSKALFEKKQIDAIEGVSPSESLEYGFERLDDAIYYWPGWHTPCESFFLVMKKKDYEALPTATKTGLEWLSYSSISLSMSSFTYQNSLKTSMLTAIPRLNVKRIPDNLLMDMAKISQGVIEDIANSDLRSKRIYDSYKNFFKKAASWTQLGDEAFSLARSLTLSYLDTFKDKP